MSVNVKGNQVMRHHPTHRNPHHQLRDNINSNSNKNLNHVITTGQILFSPPPPPPPPKYSSSSSSLFNINTNNHYNHRRSRSKPNSHSQNQHHHHQSHHHHKARRGSESELNTNYYLEDQQKPTPKNNPPQLILSEGQKNLPTVTRAYRLYNLMAKGTLIIDKDKNKVTATGTDLDERGEIGLESLMKDDVVKTRIYGLLTDKYLCFNNKGRLVAKPKGRARGPKCEFIEEVEPWTGSSKFKSASNSLWYVGFSVKGHPLLGPAHISSHPTSSTNPPANCQDCFRFYKTPVTKPLSRSLSSSTHNNKTPLERLTSDHFNPRKHNSQIGQMHPGLDSDFLANFPFDPIEKSTTTTTTGTPGRSNSSGGGGGGSKSPKKKTKLRKSSSKNNDNILLLSSTTLPPLSIFDEEEEEAAAPGAAEAVVDGGARGAEELFTPTLEPSTTTTSKPPHRHRHRHHRKKKVQNQPEEAEVGEPFETQTIDDPFSSLLLLPHQPSFTNQLNLSRINTNNNNNSNHRASNNNMYNY